MFCRQSIHYFTFVIHFNTHSFHFSVFLRNPQSEEKRSTCTQKEVLGDFSISDMNNICVNKVTLITLMPINIEIDQITIDFISASVLKEYSQAIFNY